MTRVIFMGSPDFALPSLRALAQTYTLVGVVTQPDRVAGRGRELKPPPVKTLAQQLGIPVIQPPKVNQPESLAQLRAWAPDLIVVAAFGQILKTAILELPPFGCLNVHASLLPRWRGAAPIQAALLAGDEETGVTIMQMDAGLDTGPILAKRALRLKPDDTAASVSQALSTLGADLLLETLPAYLAGDLQPLPQPAEGVTYAPMLKKEDGRLDFTAHVAELERKVRAFNPWPGAFMEVDGAPLKIHRAHIAPLPPQAEAKAQAGQRLIVQNQPAVVARSGVLVLDEVQPAGKKPMSGKAFLAGARNWSD
jgi:methionyl-tRNA formyltransferase